MSISILYLGILSVDVLMAGKPADSDRDHLHILQQHALEPVSTAESIATTDWDEIQAEREAFAEFAKRVGNQQTQTRSPPPSSTDRRLNWIMVAFRYGINRSGKSVSNLFIFHASSISTIGWSHRYSTGSSVP